MRTIPWHRLVPKHHRLLVWWALAGIGIAAPWLIGGGGLSLFQGATRSADGAALPRSTTATRCAPTCGGEQLKVRLLLHRRPGDGAAAVGARRAAITCASITPRRGDAAGRAIPTVTGARWRR